MTDHGYLSITSHDASLVSAGHQLFSDESDVSLTVTRALKQIREKTTDLVSFVHTRLANTSWHLQADHRRLLLPQHHQRSLLIGCTCTQGRLPPANLCQTHLPSHAGLRGVGQRGPMVSVQSVGSWGRSFRDLRCQLMINFRSRFKFERTSQPLATSTLSSDAGPSDGASAGRPGTWHLSGILKASHTTSVPSPSRTFHRLCGCLATVLFLDATRAIDLP